LIIGVAAFLPLHGVSEADRQAIATATVTAAGCLAGLVDAVQTLSALAS
jgi:hypothetical protein